MEINNDDLVKLITKLVIEELNINNNKSDINSDNLNTNLTTDREAQKSIDQKEVVIALAPAFISDIKNSINGLSLEKILSELKAGIEEEGMNYRVVKVYKTSDVAFVGLEGAKLSGSGISIGIQSKGTAIIHQKDLYPLSNLELFAQAPLLTYNHYRAIGKNAAKYAKGEKVIPIKVENDPMIRSSYQVKAALMHIKETQLTIDNAKTINSKL